MNIKLKYHLMPWEIDYALLTFSQLKKSSYYLNTEDKIYMDIGLNLSSYIINWEKTLFPKHFFVEKFNSIVKILDFAEVKTTIYEGNELWGHLDLEKSQIEPHIDYYISICPDMWFHEHLLFYIIESAKQIKNKYFIITPEIHKLWDYTWDELTNFNFKDIPYDQWDKTNIFNIQNIASNLEEPYIQSANKFKYAGWFDLYSKSFIEELVPIPDSWKGYGPWDYYSMLASEHAKQSGVDVQEYILRNQIISEYHPNKKDKYNFDNFYKDNIKRNNIPNQREIVESNFPHYIQEWIQNSKNKNIL
jgi:hypothetical protein